MATPPSPRALSRLKRWLLPIVAAYVGLLLVSHGVRALRSDAEPLPNDRKSVTVQAVQGDGRTMQPVHIAYHDYKPARADAATASGSDLPVVVLLHGSPGSVQDFSRLVPTLSQNYRLLIPDLPGFGKSTRDIPDYSFRAHAHYVLQMLDELGVEHAHLVGFSMGGSVALNIFDLAPERVDSFTMLSSLGVQELELLGNYHINHLIHGVQLGALWLLYEGVPHFGVLDDVILNIPYARNFYDSDQRPLRGFLQEFDKPMLIIHSSDDFLVPIEAAMEHHRLVPQSELHLVDGGHFILFMNARVTGETLADFLNRVEHGTVQTRNGADPSRVAAAARPFNAMEFPMAMGFALVILCLVLALATLVSEDLACVAAGVLVAQGRLDFAVATTACFMGILAGDVMLMLAGRVLGRSALQHAPLKWIVRAEDVEKSSAWFHHRGGVVILLSRFLPGVRLPTYVAAGILSNNVWKVILFMGIAVALWTPMIVGLSALLGTRVLGWLQAIQGSVFVQLVVAALIVLVMARLMMALLSFKGRRLLVASWLRKVRWEFWPPWLFYPPVIVYILFLTVKHRSLTVFTAANPGIPGGGLVGESKIEILRHISSAEEHVAQATCISANLTHEERVHQAHLFMTRNGFDYPIVLKPDVGERGFGVAIIHNETKLAEYLQNTDVDTIIQVYVDGAEFGVFYYRYPGAERGSIFSITDKQFPTVVGDGVSTLEQLILKDNRAVCMATAYFRRQPGLMYTIPNAGEQIRLVDIGTHCRGAIFLDGGHLKTPALEAAIDRVSKEFEGFYFGRFDIRTPSIDDFQQGHNFKIVELNGVTSEATSIYDPKNNVLDAYAMLCHQWRIAFEIGAENRARGARPLPLNSLLRLIFDYLMQDSARSMVTSDTPLASGVEQRGNTSSAQ